MKRSEALQQLSRDHHRALEAALKLRRATDADARQVAAAFLDFWRDHGRIHFRVEEEVMLPGTAHRVDPNDPAVVRVLTDHIEIRNLADGVADGSGAAADQLNALGKKLTDHVHHEERVLFPLIEKNLSDEELGSLAQRTEDAERSGGGQAPDPYVGDRALRSDPER